MELWYTNIFYWEKGMWKTYYLVREALEAHNRWEIIISNVWVDFPHIRFHRTAWLIPILREIAEYNYYETMPMLAPRNFLKAYWIKRKKGTPLKFFILFDEIGIHLNHRNWSKNFKDELLHDMIMEPRKYWITLVWICQVTSTVDIEFLKMVTHWNEVKKWWWWIFERVKITHLYVPDWKISERTYERGHTNKWHYIQKKKDLSEFFWWLYYTREIQWYWANTKNTPSLFIPWSIFSPPLLTAKVSEESEPSEDMGVEGASPS